MTDDYPSNSKNPPMARPSRPRETAVITNIQVRKKPMVSRIGGRATEVIRDVFLDVIKPLMQDTLAEALHAATDGAVFRNAAPRPRAHRGPRHGSAQQVSNTGYVITDYNSQYQTGVTPSAANSNVVDPYSRPFDFSIYTFDNYAAGQELIDRLRHIVTGYHRATANDLYDLLGKTAPIGAPGENYGWATLAEIDAIAIRRVRGRSGEYYLDIPDARPIKA